MFKEFTIGFSRTINLGNFESCRVEATITTGLPPDVKAEEYDRLLGAAQAELRRLLVETYKAQYDDRKKGVTQNGQA